MCGTPNYVSPEVISKKPYGISTDLWALGCILYAIYTGKPPFESDTVVSTLNKVKTMSFKLTDDIPEDANEIISSLLSIDPGNRITIDELINSK